MQRHFSLQGRRRVAGRLGLLLLHFKQHFLLSQILLLRHLSGHLLLIGDLRLLLLGLHLLRLLHFLHQQDLLLPSQLLLVVLGLAIRGQHSASPFRLLLLLGRVLLTVLVVEQWLLLRTSRWRPLLHARLVLR